MALSVHTNSASSQSNRVPEDVGGPSHGFAERLIWGVLGLVVFVVIAVGVVSLRDQTGGRGPEALPVLGHLPDFSLLERSGRPLTRSDLSGQVWIANFIFTSCQGVCPLLSTRMAKLRRSLADSEPPVLSVSLSVDPTRDSPDVLRDYAKRYGADPDDWLFVTGEPAEIRSLISEGFRLSIAERSPEEADDGELITHSDRFVLVDQHSQIRGYYRGNDNEVVSRLKDDLERLKRSG